MSKCSHLLAGSRLALSGLFALALTVACVAAPSRLSGSEAARLATYQSQNGSDTFALSLMPPEASAKTADSDVVVLFDTSASQTGAYRQDALNALQTFLEGLGSGDRVRLLAVDLNAIDLTGGWVTPGSGDLVEAIAKLNKRVPLGSTDMANVLQNALDLAGDDASRNHNIVYIGDGISRANILGTEEYRQLVNNLVTNQTSVSSFAIGPQRDIAFLASLSNHTGGNVFVDNDEERSVDVAAVGLLKTIRNSVIWPTSVELPSALTEVYPRRMPPLRTDRDTIVIGSISAAGEYDVSIDGTINGNPINLDWKVTSESSNEDLSFLDRLVENARADEGISLPTLGSDGLREMARAMLDSAQGLSTLGNQALASGDKTGALRLADAALSRDPDNLQAIAVRNAAMSDSKAASQAGLRLVVAQDQDSEDVNRGELLQEFEERGEFLDTIESDRELISQRIQAQVESDLKNARNQMIDSPEIAKEELKGLLQGIQRTPDLDPDVRADLVDKITAAIRQAHVKQVEINDRRVLADQRLAMARERERLLDEAARKEETIKQLLVKFNSLIHEYRFQESVDGPAFQALTMAPFNPTTNTAYLYGQMLEGWRRITVLKAKRQRNFVLAFHAIEEAAIPFPDSPPIVYPDPEFWERITRQREKYKAVDLVDPDGAEARINSSLDDDASFDFFEQSLEEVAQEIADAHGIPVELDLLALETLGLGSDTIVTKQVSGVTLRSALRLILKPLELTYMVQDEVLKITTQEEAEANLITKVYNVGDLVVPILSGGLQGGGIGGQLNGGGGGLGGGGGGFGGGGGGGFGGGGGGFGGGGGGFGGGGGGGILAIQDELKLGVSRSKAQPAASQNTMPTTKKVSAIKLDAPKGEHNNEAWDAYFAENFADPSRVSQTARDLMNSRKFDETISLIQAALRHNQPQPWMYETLGLALQAIDAPKTELERALMSAVDMSSNLDDTMLVAMYMTKVGLDQRAMQLYKEVAMLNPTRHEPYMLALRVAERLDDFDGIRWACSGILSQTWPENLQEVPRKARRVAFASMLKLKQEENLDQLRNFEKELRGSLVRDCVVKVTWTGDADIDLLVEEPTGTICSHQNPRSSAGGVLMGDSFSQEGEGPIEGTSESYSCSEGFAGDYRVVIRKIYGDVSGGKVTLDVTRNAGTDFQTHERQQIEVGEGDSIVFFKLDEGRRIEPLEEHQVATAVSAQSAVNQSILAQQLDPFRGSRASRDYDYDTYLRERYAERTGLRGGVGFRPVITTFPEGANFTATAVVSADRRYVRITPFPFFSQIVSVSTFNFVTGAQN